MGGTTLDKTVVRFSFGLDGRQRFFMPQKTSAKPLTLEDAPRRPLALAFKRGPRRSGEPIPEGENAQRTLRRDATYRRTLASVDMLAATAAVVLGVAVLGEDALTWGALIALPGVVLVGKIVGLYDRDEHLMRKTTLDEVPRLFEVATLYALLVWLLEDFFVEGTLGRTQVVGLWGTLFIFMAIGRISARRWAGARAASERCLLVGDRQSASRIAAKLEDGPGVNAVLVGRVSLEPAGGDSECLGSLEQLPFLIATHHIERVIIAPRTSEGNEFLDTIRLVKALGAKVSVLPRLLEVVGSSVEFDDLHGVTLLGLRRFGLTQSSLVIKRTMDVTGAACGLLVLALPLALIALAVKLTSRGPVIFRQRRVGSADREFEILKFRTMCEGADAQKVSLLDRNETDGFFKISDDPRVTPVGRFLRRTSLDELPQLWNVLRGDMSLVGPRPLIPDEDARIEGWERQRLTLRPGMTGFWQVAGSSRIPLHEMVTIDYLYGANWSLWEDLKLLLRTVPVVVGQRGR